MCRTARWRRRLLVGCVAGSALAAIVLGWLASSHDLLGAGEEQAPAWSAADVALLHSLSVDALPDRPEDPSNAFAFDAGAAALGKSLFHDTRLSAGNHLSCATCHRPELAFTDGLRISRGQSAGQRNAPTLLGVAFSRTFNWDGRIDTLWGQALGPIEHADEMGSTRGEVARLVFEDVALRSAFERVFGPLDAALLAGIPNTACGPVTSVAGAPAESASAARCWDDLGDAQRAAISRVFVNVGKAIASHVASLRPPVSRFDQFARALAAGDTRRASTWLTAAEQRGLRLFITPARTACLNCHNGPMFSNGGIHDIGTNLGAQSTRELGNMLGVRLLESSPFRCDGIYSDALAEQCLHARFEKAEPAGQGRGAFKVPTLRSVALTAPYMHDGRFPDLKSVLQHYREPPLPSVAGAHELLPLQLSSRDVDDLVRFLGTLQATR